MAFAATVEFDVRTTGSDSNGGGFDTVSGTPGTDYSQQDSPQVTYTDLVIDGTTNTKCTSAGTPFTSAHVGNLINITSGTGFTVQRVQILSVTAAVATCDKSLGTLSSTGGNGKLGGGLLTIGAANTLGAVSGNKIHIKSGTYTQTAEIVCAAAAQVFIGYGTSHYDNGTMPLITTANDITMFGCRDTTSGTTTIFDNLYIKCTQGASTHGAISADNGAVSATVIRCKIDSFKYGVFGDFAIVWNFGATLINNFTGILVMDCWFLNCQYGVVNSSGVIALNCNFDTCSQAGFATGTSNNVGKGAFFQNCLFAGCSYGVKEQAAAINLMYTFINCTFANSTNDGFLSAFTYNATSYFIICNCVFYGNGGKAINVAAGTVPTIYFNNAYGSNTGGNHPNIAITVGDIALTASPFVTGTDFSPNANAGGGGSLRGASMNGLFNLSADSLDIGALRHTDAGATSSQIMISL